MNTINFNDFQTTIQTFNKSEYFSNKSKDLQNVIYSLENQGETLCFLESATESQAKSIYSILAFGTNFKLEGEEISHKLEQTIIQTKHLTNENLQMVGALFGYISYNSVRHFEPTVKCGNPSLIPDGLMFLPKTIIIIENKTDKFHIASINKINENNSIEETLNLIKEAHVPTNFKHTQTSSKAQGQMQAKVQGHFHENVGFYSNITENDYKSMVEDSIKYIKKGDIFQIVPSIRFFKEYTKHPLEFYAKLKSINPSPYMFYFSSFYNNEEYHIIGASPEILINCQNNEITLRPLAGTIKRGQTPQEDEQNAAELLSNPKEISEHLMLLDLGRSDIGRIATKTWVEKQMVIEKYSHVMHISSTVKGTLDQKYSMVDVLKSGLPAGTLSGAPKIRAMQIISQLETISRDFYAGTLGYISHNTLQTCIMLRCVLIKNNTLHAQAGAGVVYDSSPQSEYQECINKVRAIAVASQ